VQVFQIGSRNYFEVLLKNQEALILKVYRRHIQGLQKFIFANFPGFVPDP
jgi:hypothetical protein